MAAFCSQTDLAIALGGDEVLAQLADPNGTGSVQASLVEDYLEGPAGKIRSAVEVKHDPETIDNLDDASKRTLRDCNKWLSAEVAWLEGGRGQAIPQHITVRADQERIWLDSVAEGRRRLGRVTGGNAPALNQPVGTVDHDPIATSLIQPTRAESGVSIASFKLGFR